MMTVCAECGKRIVVTWPEFYFYKRGKGEDTCYFCSENCMIVADTREMKDRIGWVDPQAEMTEEEIEAVTHGRPVGFRRLRKTARREEQPAAPAGQERTGQEMGNSRNAKKLTREEKEKAVELAIDGKDPIGYLKECGAKNPWASWAYIKQTLKKAKPEKYAQLPGDDDRLGEEVSFGAQAAPEAKPAAPEAKAAAPEAPEPDVDYLEGFVAYDPGAPEGDKAADLVINAEDLAAAEDPAVKRMEAFARMETTDRVPPVVGRLVMDEHGLHTVQEKQEQKHSMGLDEAVRKMDEAQKSPDFMEVRQTADGITIRKKKPSYEVMELFGIPCEVTGVKLEGFEFGKVSEGLRVDFPGGSLLWGTGPAVPVIMDAEQWKRLAEILPKVMKILRIE